MSIRLLTDMLEGIRSGDMPREEQTALLVAYLDAHGAAAPASASASAAAAPAAEKKKKQKPDDDASSYQYAAVGSDDWVMAHKKLGLSADDIAGISSVGRRLTVAQVKAILARDDLTDFTDVEIDDDDDHINSMQSKIEHAFIAGQDSRAIAQLAGVVWSEAKIDAYLRKTGVADARMMARMRIHG